MFFYFEYFLILFFIYFNNKSTIKKKDYTDYLVWFKKKRPNNIERRFIIHRIFTINRRGRFESCQSTIFICLEDFSSPQQPVVCWLNSLKSVWVESRTRCIIPIKSGGGWAIVDSIGSAPTPLENTEKLLLNEKLFVAFTSTYLYIW